MTWLVASAERTEIGAVRDGAPALWRELRRYNAPVQLAVAAAHEVVAHARLPAEAALVSLAPCQAGSPDLHRWVRAVEEGSAQRMNPTHTLHSVDNLGLSVLAIALGNHAWGLGLGGAPGMFWVALELTCERSEPEVIVFGGDQGSGYDGTDPEGVALLFSREPAPHASLGRTVKLVGIERRRATGPRAVIANAAAGARSMLAILGDQPPGELAYRVPAMHGDGIDDLVVTWELG
ncbi:MAG: hypothetical protein H0T42_19505 [Deltaproteobacteria bacterium]|nr:hypothetical protein [Deltaproteobacteria bacterium]